MGANPEPAPQDRRMKIATPISHPSRALFRSVLLQHRGDHANETKERTFFNILLMPWRSGGTLDELYDKRPRALCRFKRMAGLATQTFDQSNPSSFNERCTAGRAFIRSK